MKKTKIILSAALLFVATGVQGMTDQFKNGVLHFDYKAEELAPAEAAARVQLEKDLADFVAMPAAQRTFDNTILGYYRIFKKYHDALGVSGFLGYVSTDKKLRDAVTALEMQVSQYMVDVAARRDIYRAIRQYTDTNPQLDPVQAKLVKEMLIGFKYKGMELNDEDLEKFIRTNDYDVCCFGYDPYNAEEFVKRWANENGSFGIEKVAQGSRTESVPLGEIKMLAEDRKLLFDQELMSFCMGNAVTIEDTNGNRKLMKKRSDAKIDAVASTMDAYVA